MANTPPATPTPMPILEPLLKPSAGLGVGEFEIVGLEVGLVVGVDVGVIDVVGVAPRVAAMLTPSFWLQHVELKPLCLSFRDFKT